MSYVCYGRFAVLKAKNVFMHLENFTLVTSRRNFLKCTPVNIVDENSSNDETIYESVTHCLLLFIKKFYIDALCNRVLISSHELYVASAY